mmetsp:Transcript_40264/g.67498  ORF Transcript_40264/g.67498 Transcript_40264/m.67498 type:complete len:204 (-) Transcript_40264:122-733(-)
MVGLPLHPPLEDGTRSRHVAQHLLHVDVLVPQLIHARQQLHGTVPQVARMVHAAVPHLHVHVLQPNGNVVVVHVQRALPDRARTGQVALAFFPFRVLHPGALVPSYSSDSVLKLLSLLQPVFGQLFRIGDPAKPRAHFIFLPFFRLADDLLRCDLHGCRCFVLDLGGARELLLHRFVMQAGAQRIRHCDGAVLLKGRAACTWL